jgi:hypothetical protein
MEVSYGEGVATHADPESCVSAGNFGREALTGERAGRVLSRKIHAPLRRVLWGADAVEIGGRQYPSRREREARWDPVRSETPCTYGSTSHGNREIPRPPADRGSAGRIGNPKGIRR